ncbi:MAG: hypothetical protein GTO49_00530 [Anaerolineae bacterium]|nr:hypothetical protein [Anaerolineae bacterium]
MDKKRLVAVHKCSRIIHYFCADICQLSQHYEVDSRGVYTWIIGEHGLLVDLLEG